MNLFLTIFLLFLLVPLVITVVEVKHSHVCIVRVKRGEAEKPAAFATPDRTHKGRLNTAPVLVAFGNHLMF